LPWTEYDEKAIDPTKPPTAEELQGLGVMEIVESFLKSTYGTNHEAERLEDETAPKAKRPKTVGGGLGDTEIDFLGLAKTDELGRCTAAVLKKYCKENELAVSGVKSALAARVKEHALHGAA
jgi:hypothetical protein